MSYLPPTDLSLGPAWLADAICSQIDPAIFFPEKGESPREAKRLCGGCDFRAVCLAWSLANPDSAVYGIYGGTTASERARMRRETRAA